MVDEMRIKLKVKRRLPSNAHSKNNNYHVCFYLMCLIKKSPVELKTLITEIYIK